MVGTTLKHEGELEDGSVDFDCDLEEDDDEDDEDGLDEEDTEDSAVGLHIQDGFLVGDNNKKLLEKACHIYYDFDNIRRHHMTDPHPNVSFRTSCSFFVIKGQVHQKNKWGRTDRA